VIACGPTWGKHSEEWIFHFVKGEGDPERFSADAAADRIRKILNLPDLNMKILNVSHWGVDRIAADRYQKVCIRIPPVVAEERSCLAAQGRVFLAGDAVHK
jgi:2,4-dichlorophenol 6-monooxygenase